MPGSRVDAELLVGPVVVAALVDADLAPPVFEALILREVVVERIAAGVKGLLRHIDALIVLKAGMEFLRKLIDGAPIQTALMTAAKASSIAVTRSGAAPSIPSIAEVEKGLMEK